MAMNDADVVKWILACRDEADEAKRDRMVRNGDNYDAFNLKHDFNHKIAGQSTEVLSKVSMAVEQIKSFFQQALADLGEWWRAEAEFPGAEEAMAVRPHEITALTTRKLADALYFSHVGNTIETALLASLACSKTFGCEKPKPKFIARKKGRGSKLKRWVEKIEDSTWGLDFRIVRAENYYPDPTGANLYEIEDAWPDLHALLELAEDDPDYDLALIKAQPRAHMSDVEQDGKRARENGQNTTSSGHRPRPKITEYWGDILNSDGECEYENCQAVVMNDTHLIMKPRPNPLWHQRRPYTASPLIEVANSVWHRALMDAPTAHNHALVEMYNLMVDAAMKQVHAITQLRKDALANPAQVQNGLLPGTTLIIDSSIPVGGKVLEPLTAVQIPAEVFNVFNIMAQEFNSSALTNDLRQGVMPFRAVKATEVVEASQTITSVFQGMAKNYEARQSVRELELAWMTVAQNWDKIAKEEFVALFGPERGEQLSQLSPEEVFASTVNGIKFRVFGITQTLNKAQDFRKLTTLLQTIAGAPPLMEAYVQKYSIEKTLGEVMTSLNIDKHKLEIPQAQQMTMQDGGGEPPPEQGGPDMMSQTPEPGGSMADMMGAGQAGMPSTEFPGSPALIGGNA